jgi:hypothetical protein
MMWASAHAARVDPSFAGRPADGRELTPLVELVGGAGGLGWVAVKAVLIFPDALI